MGFGEKVYRRKYVSGEGSSGSNGTTALSGERFDEVVETLRRDYSGHRFVEMENCERYLINGVLVDLNLGVSRSVQLTYEWSSSLGEGDVKDASRRSEDVKVCLGLSD